RLIDAYDVHCRSGVSYGYADYSVGGHAAPPFTTRGPHGDSAARRLQPIYAAARSRNTYGAPAVTAMSHRYDPRSHRSCSASTRTTHRAICVPRVPGSPTVANRLGRWTHTQL